MTHIKMSSTLCTPDQHWLKLASEVSGARSSIRTIPPNKALEPTSTSVTSRAIEFILEMKQMSPDRNAARGAPAVAVAHL